MTEWLSSITLFKLILSTLTSKIILVDPYSQQDAMRGDKPTSGKEIGGVPCTTERLEMLLSIIRYKVMGADCLYDNLYLFHKFSK